MCIKTNQKNTVQCVGCDKQCKLGCIYSYTINKFIPTINNETILYYQDEHGRIQETTALASATLATKQAIHIANLCSKNTQRQK